MGILPTFREAHRLNARSTTSRLRYAFNFKQRLELAVKSIHVNTCSTIANILNLYHVYPQQNASQLAYMNYDILSQSGRDSAKGPHSRNQSIS